MTEQVQESQSETVTEEKPAKRKYTRRKKEQPEPEQQATMKESGNKVPVSVVVSNTQSAESIVESEAKPSGSILPFKQHTQTYAGVPLFEVDQADFDADGESLVSSNSFATESIYIRNSNTGAYKRINNVKKA